MQGSTTSRVRKAELDELRACIIPDFVFMYWQVLYEAGQWAKRYKWKPHVARNWFSRSLEVATLVANDEYGLHQVGFLMTETVETKPFRRYFVWRLLWLDNLSDLI